ncbi:MAG: SUMF1/EgtB/PvdO family nonheme iron enzyme, partial [Verrucomicrobia bacterium]|nr:SUMF1/EgtB/PvdO family nonheme iron enzyme [Verrucomicrobiota bacterium]
YPTSAVTDPMGPDIGDYRVTRGDSWFNTPRFCRSAHRGNFVPEDYYKTIGFRVALAPVQYNDVQTVLVAEPIGAVEIKAGENYTFPLSEKVNLDMVWVEPGTFTMGSPEDELGRTSNEIQHKVTLTHGFWLGKYEVAQSQYEAVMGTNPSRFKGRTDLPVGCVSWNNAMEFCEKLTAAEKEAGRLPEGYEYTLPTEAQWEYACRAGTTTAFNNGKNIPTEEQVWDEPCPNLDEVGWYYYNRDKY